MDNWNAGEWAVGLSGLALKSCLVLAAAWLITLLMKPRSAASRHLVWTAAFTILLCLPLYSIILPQLRLPFDETILTPGLTFQVDVARGPSTAAAPLQRTSNVVQPAKSTGASFPNVHWTQTLFLLWAAGATLGIGRMALAWRSLHSARRGAIARPDATLSPLAAQVGVTGDVEVLETRGGMPMAFGLMRPAVFLPSEASGWSEERRRVVLLHELAHIRRGDPATHILARIALCLHWWNPLAWLGWRAFLIERETAADDLVLRAGERASNYAGHLLEIAKTLQAPPSLRWAAVAMVRRSQLEGRVMAILDSNRIRNGFGRAASAAAVITALLIAAPLATVRGQNSAAQGSPDVEATIRAAAAQKNHAILETAARQAEAVRDFEAARKLLDKSLQIRGEANGDQSVTYGIGLLKLADLERRRNHPADALQFYQKAADVLGNRAEAAPAITYLGIDAALRKNYTQAEDLLNRAQLLDPSKAATAMMWMAIVKKQQAKFEEAEGMYQAALVAENENTNARATILELYAIFLRGQNREQEASTSEDRARAIRKSLTIAAGGSAPVLPATEGAAPAPYAATGVMRIGSGVSAPKLSYKEEPKYSEEARLAKYQGTVIVTVVVGTDGLAHDIHVLRGLGLGLDDRAIDAINQWRFQPGMKENQPVAVQATIEVNFRLI